MSPRLSLSRPHHLSDQLSVEPPSVLAHGVKDGVLALHEADLHPEVSIQFSCSHSAYLHPRALPHPPASLKLDEASLELSHVVQRDGLGYQGPCDIFD